MVHTFRTELTWELLQALSRVDRFAGEWAGIERREGRSLKLDDPSLSAPVYANLVEGEDDNYSLIWSRPDRKTGE